MLKRTFLLLLCLSVLLTYTACGSVPSSKENTTGLAGFTQALTTAGYTTLITTASDGTTVVELVPPTTVGMTLPAVPTVQPTVPVQTTATAAETTVAVTTGPAVIPPVIIIQPTVPTVVIPTRPAVTVTTPTVPAMTTKAPTVPATAPRPTTVTVTTAQPTVPEITVPSTTAQPTVSATTVPSTTAKPTVPVTTVPPTTVPATTIPVTTVPVTTVPPTTQTPATTQSGTDHQIQTQVHYTERYLYSILDEVQKDWYRKIDTAVHNLEDSVLLGDGFFEGENYYIYYLYMMDNPEHFYLSNRIGIFSGSDGDGLLIGYSDGVLTSGAVSIPGTADTEYLDATPELKQSIRTKQAVLKAKVAEIINTISPELPAVEKERLLYDRIILNSYYNQYAQWDGYAEDNWSAYGVMINGFGVCESYSEAFQLLCYCVGINCTGVVGGGHKWNAVCLDGEWYMCDPTWDDPIGGIPFVAYHEYFNVTTQQILADHVIDESHWQVPVCTATQYSYQNYFGH